MEKFKSPDILNRLAGRARYAGAIGAAALALIAGGCGSGSSQNRTPKNARSGEAQTAANSRYEVEQNAFWNKADNDEKTTNATSTDHGFKAIYNRGKLNIFIPEHSGVKPGSKIELECSYDQPGDTRPDDLITVNYYDDFRAPSELPGKVLLRHPVCTAAFGQIELDGTSGYPAADFSSLHPK